MPDSTIRIIVDPSGAVRGTRVVDRSLGQIRQAFNRTDRQISTTRANFAGFGRSLVGALGVTGGLVAVVNEFRNVIRVGQEFSQTISELSAITGAAGDDLLELSDAAREIGRSTSIGAAAAAEGFKLIASAKPDLLENRDALIEVTREAVTLAEAAGLTLPDAARALGGALNQFNADADQAGRFINVLAAGSQRGATEIPDLTESLRLAGTAASTLGLEFETTIAAIETLGEVNLKGAEAGTQFRNVLLALKQTGIDELDPSTQGLATALENLNQLQLESTDLLKIFGRETFVAASALLERTDRLRNLEDQITNTTVAEEQARTTQDNLTGDITRLTNAVEDLRIELFTRSEPAIRTFVQSLTDGIGVISEFTREITLLTDTSARISDELSAASTEFIDRRLAEERQVLEDIKQSNAGIQGTLRDAVGFTQLGFLFDSSAEVIREQEEVVAAIERVKQARQEAAAVTTPVPGEDTPTPEPTRNLASGDAAAIRARLLAGRSRGGRGDREGRTRLTDEQREAQRLAEQQARSFANLRAELLPLVAAEEEFAASQEVLNEQFRLGQIDSEELATLQARLTEEYEKSITPAEELTEQQKLQMEILEGIQGPTQDAIANITTLNQLYADGKISLEQFNEALEGQRLTLLDQSDDLADGVERGLIRVENSFGDFADVAERTVGRAFGAAEEAIVDFRRSGEISIKGLADSIIDEIFRISLQQGILAPLAGFFQTGSTPGVQGGTSGGGGGGFGDLIGAGLQAFASFQDGGIQNTPTVSKIAEGGPEGIVPLKGGAIPVKLEAGSRGSSVVNNFNITTPDADSFRQSRDQILAQSAISSNRANQRNN